MKKQDIQELMRRLRREPERFFAIVRRVAPSIPAHLLHSFACDCAERALQSEREAGREPPADAWVAIAVKREWIEGRASEADRKQAEKDARAAMRSVWGQARNRNQNNLKVLHSAAESAFRATGEDALHCADAASQAAVSAARQRATLTVKNYKDEATRWYNRYASRQSYRKAMYSGTWHKAWDVTSLSAPAIHDEREWQRQHLGMLLELHQIYLHELVCVLFQRSIRLSKRLEDLSLQMEQVLFEIF